MTMRDQCIEAAKNAIREVGYTYLPEEHAEAAYNAIIEKLKSPTEEMLDNEAIDRIVLDRAHRLHSSELPVAEIWQAMLSTLSQQEGK